MDCVVEQVPGLPHHEHTKIGYFDEGDQEFKNVRHPSMDLKSETENRKLACARVLKPGMRMRISNGSPLLLGDSDATRFGPPSLKYLAGVDLHLLISGPPNT